MNQKHVRNSRHYSFGDNVGCRMLSDILPREVACIAATTCRFTIQGPESVGVAHKNWGQWIRTNMQTHGNIPRMRHAWQCRKDGWIGADSREAAELILDCFGLSVDDLFKHFGQPQIGKVYQVDLVDVVSALAPDIARVDQPKTVSAVA